MKRLSKNGKVSYVSDYVVYRDSENYVMVHTNQAPRWLRNMVYASAYLEDVFKDKPFLQQIIDRSYMIIDFVDKRNLVYLEWKRAHLHKLEAQGWHPVIVASFAGAKMGGKKHPVDFIASNDVISELLRDVFFKRYEIQNDVCVIDRERILPEIATYFGISVDDVRSGIVEEYKALAPAKRFERFKKILNKLKVPLVRPRVLQVKDDHPFLSGLDGVCLGNPLWMCASGIEAGDKMTFIGKDVIHPIPDGWDFGDYDLIIRESANKLKLGIEKFAALVAFDPELTAAKRFSQNLTVKVKNGEDYTGRDPNFGIDLQAYCCLMPQVDLGIVNQVLRGDFNDEVKEKFFMYKNDAGDLLLNKLGREIFERGKNLGDREIRYQIYDILFKYIVKTLRDRVKGYFGTAAPLRLAPPEATMDLAQRRRSGRNKRVIVGYSGGIVAKGEAVIYNNVIYVDEHVWDAMGRDFDGDLCFIFPYRSFPDRSIISSIDELKKYYVLPEKKGDVDDKRSEIDTLIDILIQSRLVGTYYNNIMVAAEALRRTDHTHREVVNFTMSEMAMLETNIRALKGKAENTVPKPDVILMNRGYGVVQNVKEIGDAMKYFYALRSRGNVLIDGDEYHPLEALAIRAQNAKPGASGFWEPLVSQFKSLVYNPPIRPPEPEDDYYRNAEVVHGQKPVEKSMGKSTCVASNSTVNSKKEVKVMKKKSIVKKLVNDVCNKAIMGIEYLDRIIAGGYEDPEEPVPASKPVNTGKEVIPNMKNSSWPALNWKPFPVAGVTWEGRQGMIRSLKKDEKMYLVLEPNKDHPYAIGVYVGKKKIGWVPDQGENSKAHILSDKIVRKKFGGVVRWFTVGDGSKNIGVRMVVRTAR